MYIYIYNTICSRIMWRGRCQCRIHRFSQIQELGLRPAGRGLVGHNSGDDAGDLLFGHHCLQAPDTRMNFRVEGMCC